LIGYYTTIEDLPNSIKFKWHKQVTGSQDDIVTDHSFIVQMEMTPVDIKSPCYATQIRMDHAKEHVNFDIQLNPGGIMR